jgi:hypothetical protein
MHVNLLILVGVHGYITVYIQGLHVSTRPISSWCTNVIINGSHANQSNTIEVNSIKGSVN